MDDAGGVSDDEDVGDLLRDLQLGGPIESVLECLAEVLPFDELQDQPVTLLVFDVVVYAADVRVIELGEYLRFAEKAGLRLRVQALFGANRLQRDSAFERLIEADIDLAHAARAEAMKASVVRHLRVERGLLTVLHAGLEDFETRPEASAQVRLPVRSEERPERCYDLSDATRRRRLDRL